VFTEFQEKNSNITMGNILMAEHSNGDSEPNYLWQN